MRRLLKNLCVKAWAFVALAFSITLIYLLSLPLSRPIVSLSAAGGKNARREYALYSASSSARFSEGKTLADLPFICGETVIFETESTEQSTAAAREIADFYGAAVVETERAGGGVSYYCFSQKIGLAQCVIVGGKAVNLHIFLKDGEVRAGVPLIFGGY
ncbi:MAG: hypothetical protein ACI4SH_00730 [Candidatus Scatosoma sp.]